MLPALKNTGKVLDDRATREPKGKVLSTAPLASVADRPPERRDVMGDDEVELKRRAAVNAVRRQVTESSLAATGIAEFLAARVSELERLGTASTVSTQADLIPLLADDMKLKNPREANSDDDWRRIAADQITSNDTRALTTSTDRYIALAGGERFDMLHEFIHICSAPGGESALHKFKLQMNEGAINYFSELTAPVLNIARVPRYPVETAVARKLVKLIGEEGITELYSATFKGEIDSFFQAVGDAFVALGDEWPNGKVKGFSEKSWTPAQAANEIKGKVKNWSVRWFDPLPER